MKYVTIFLSPSTGLSGILLSSRAKYFPKGQNMKKYQQYIDVPTPKGTTTAVATSKLSGKTDLSVTNF